MENDARDPRDNGRRKTAHRWKPGTRVSVDELVAKSQTVFERVVPILGRAASRIRSKLVPK